MFVCRTVSEIFSVKEWRGLETGLGVVQGHWEWRRSIERIPLSINRPLTIRKLGSGFLFAFHSNYGSILHHLRDKDIGQKSWFFSYPHEVDAPLGSPRRSIAIPFRMEKLEWWGYPMVKKFRGHVQRCRQNTGVWQTDRQTSCDGIVCAMHTRRAVKIKWKDNGVYSSSRNTPLIRPTIK